MDLAVELELVSIRQVNQ